MESCQRAEGSVKLFLLPNLDHLVQSALKWIELDIVGCQLAFLPNVFDASKDDFKHVFLIGGHKKTCKLCFLSMDFIINRFHVFIIFVVS